MRDDPPPAPARPWTLSRPDVLMLRRLRICECDHVLVCHDPTRVPQVYRCMVCGHTVTGEV